MYRLHCVTPLECFVLWPTHCHLALPTSVAVAVAHGFLLLCAVLQRGLSDPSFSRLVTFEEVHKLFLLGFVGVFDFRAGFVGFPEVGVAAILE